MYLTELGKAPKLKPLPFTWRDEQMLASREQSMAIYGFLAYLFLCASLNQHICLHNTGTYRKA